MSELIGALETNVASQGIMVSPITTAAERGAFVDLAYRLNAKDPNWVVAGATVRGVDGEAIEVALLANPERVPDPSEIDPETDPFRE